MLNNLQSTTAMTRSDCDDHDDDDGDDGDKQEENIDDMKQNTSTRRSEEKKK